MRFKQLPFILLGAVALAIAVATFVQDSQAIYGSLWFKLLWGAVVVCGAVLMYRRRMWRRPVLCALHLSFIIILLGALVTNLTSRRGILHLRQGIPTDTYQCSAADEAGRLPCLLRLDTFEVLFYPGTEAPRDYVSHLTAEGKPLTVSMNRIGRHRGFRLYQSSYDEDLLGTVLSVNFDPWGTALTYAGYLLFLISFLSSLWRPPFNKRMAAALLLVVCAMAACVTMIFQSKEQNAQLVPVLRSSWLIPHVTCVMTGYVLLVISFFRRQLLRYAVSLLAIGIFLGAVWANVSWGAYWSWDPKESWALITLLVYSIPLHSDSLPWFRSERNYRLYSLLALATLLMTYFGVNYLLGGMHSYA